MNDSLPFGRPAIDARPITIAVPIDACADPLTIYRRLRADVAAPASRGLCLLESYEPGVPSNEMTTRRSIVATRGLIRVELRGEAAKFLPLDASAEPLIGRLRERLPPGVRDLPGGGLELPGESDGSARRRGFGQPTPEDRALEDGDRLRGPCVLDSLRAVAGLVGDVDATAPLEPGLFGAIGYEVVDQFESLPPRREDPLGEPDATFVLVTDLVVFDHVAGVVHIITRHLSCEEYVDAHRRHSKILALLQPGPAAVGAAAASASRGPAGVGQSGEPPSSVVADVQKTAFEADVLRCKAEIAAGEIFQVVLSRGFAVASDAPSLDVYAELRRRNPSPYMFHIDLPDGCLLGASPETFLRVEAGEIEIRPIAGTVARGTDDDTDRRLTLQLMLDPKEQAEHAMLLDLARNDVARVAEPGSLEVVEQMAVEKYSHVQHLVSRVRGRLRAGLDAMHAFRAAANMGTLTGAPKLRATELIRGIEPRARGFYGGAAGYLLQNGDFDSCIVIRSLREKGGVYHTRAGAGIVHDSDPEREFQETEQKARACLEAVARVGTNRRSTNDGRADPHGTGRRQELAS